MREIKLAEVESEIARGAGDAAADRIEHEALVILLIPRGSPFEMYATAIAPGIAASQGRAAVVRIDTTAEPDAPARFGLSGSPGLVIFVNGKQVAAFAVPFGGALGAMALPFIQRMIEGVTRSSRGSASGSKGELPPPGPGPR